MTDDELDMTFVERLLDEGVLISSNDDYVIESTFAREYHVLSDAGCDSRATLARMLMHRTGMSDLEIGRGICFLEAILEERV